MMNVMNAVDFQTQLTSIMEMLAKTAIVEIGKLFEENSSFVRLEISRHISVNESLKRKCNLLESELQAAWKTVEKMNGTAAPFSDGLTDTGHRPAIDTVFGKEWCMNLWRHESNVGQKEDTRVDSSVITGEPVNLIDDEPDMIIIKEETFEDHSGKNNKEEDQSNSLRGPAAASSDRCVAQTSLDFMSYTLPSEQLTDGETLMGLTEKMVENLFPTVKQPNTFLKELEHDVETSSGLQIQLTQQRSSETWPAVFSLPAFPQQIHEALQRKDPSLKKKGKSRLRSLLIQVLFDNITKHTWYPNHTIYADVLGSLITKFPFLKDCSASGHDTLLQCLRNKFKKERISLVRSSTIQELGVKRNLMDHTSSDGLGFEEEHAKRRKTTHPIYTQENLENMGEDETSFQEHISAINTELRRGQPDYTEIKNHMRQTLFKRLELMEKPTKEVMGMFPFLGVPQLVLHEIKIRFGMDLHINLENALQALAPKILRVARSGCQSELLTNLLLNIDPSTKDLEKNAALLILPSLFQENAKFLFCQENESARPTPTIIFHGASNPLDAKRASIRMDGVTIITDDMGMTEALECLFAVYFIFSVEYPKPITHTMNFIEHYLFKLYSGHKKIVYTSS